MAPTPIVDAMKSISKWSNLTKKNSERMTSNKGIDWHWMEAPHFGGVFEQMIRSVKGAVNAILGNADVNNKELQIIFTGMERLMNSRPPTPLNSDPND